MISLLEKAEVGRNEASAILDSALKGADDGELFVEQRLSEQAVFDDGRLKSASFDEAQGFGLRVVSGETQGYSHSTELSAAAMTRAAQICRTIVSASTSAVMAAPARTNRELYVAQNPSDHFAFAEKVALLQRVDEFARKADPRIKQVSVSLSGDWQEIEILRAQGQVYRDSRPLVRFHVSVMASDGKERASGSFGFGGRGLYGDYLSETKWQDAVKEAVRQSLIGLEAKPAPAGEMDVVLGPGWPGILLHEAIGHGLEGDFNRKKTSAFSGLMGERIAAPGITIVDDGTVARARGSLAMDDEGTP